MQAETLPAHGHRHGAVPASAGGDRTERPRLLPSPRLPPLSSCGLEAEPRGSDDTAASHAVAALVESAIAGDHASWNQLIERYMPLVLSIVRRHRLRDDDAEDVVQMVWLRLVEKLAEVRQPEALPGWITTTTRHECLHLIRRHKSASLTDMPDEAYPLEAETSGVDAHLLALERHEALLAGLAELPDRQRSLLLLLLEDPPLPYEEVSARLGLPIGSIGPTRARALARLRSLRAIRALNGL